MRIISVIVLLFLCVGYISARALSSEQQTPKAESDKPESQAQQVPSSQADNPEHKEQQDSKKETDNPEPQEQQASTTEADNPEQQSENVASADEESSSNGPGSTMENDEIEASGSSGSADQEYNDSPVPLPKPYHFPFMGFKGPVTITPMEPNINRQRPFKFRRPCFFCFPRGRLGRVEVTGPGGPFLMNNFGLVGYGMGFPGMGGMGPAGPASPNMGFPEYGPYPVGPLGELPPSHGEHPSEPGNGQFGGSDSDEGGMDESPMEFTDISEEPAPSHHKAASKAGHHGPKVMDHGKAAAHPAAPVAQVKAPIKPAMQAPSPVKPVSDELVKKPAAETQPAQPQQAAQPQIAQPNAANIQTPPAQSEQPAAAAPLPAAVPNTVSNDAQSQAAAKPAIREEVPQAV